MEKISIIIPIYNSEKYLSRCLESVINQTYRNIEIVCINDGSKDNSLKILREYKEKDDRIVIIDKKNAGVSMARNDGIKKSTGKYIAFVDSDDWIESDAIETLYATLIEKNVDVVRANYNINFEYDKNAFKGDLLYLANQLYKTEDVCFSTLVIDRLIDGTIPCYLCLLLIKRECVLKTSLLKSDIQLMEDSVFYIELLTKIKNIYFLEKPIYHYYYNMNSCTKSDEYYIRNMYNIVRVNSYIKEILINSSFNDEKRIRRMNAVHANIILNYIFTMYKEGKLKKVELKNELDKLYNDKKILNIIKEADLTKLPIHLKLPIQFALRKKYNNLFVFYNVRIIMGKIKDIVTKRKE